MRLYLKRLRIYAVWTVVLAAGAVMGFRGYRNAHDEFVNGLLTTARRSAVAFGAGDLAGVTGSRADLRTPAYAAIKDKLVKLGEFSPNIRRLFLIKVTDPSRMAYIADSLRAETEAGVAPGDAYQADLQTPALAGVFNRGEAACLGPFQADKDVWLTVYAPVASAGGVPTVILGMEYTVSHSPSLVVSSGLPLAFYTWTLLGLPLAAFLFFKRQSEQREVLRNLIAAIEQSHSAVMITDLNNRVEYANGGLTNQIGYPRRELLGRDWRDFQQAETPNTQLADLVETVRSGKSWSGEWYNRRKNGELYPVRGAVTPVTDSNGRLACYVAVFDDMTEVKANESRLREALERAEAGDRAKSQFLATISHEVRTPLNGIVGFAGLLSNTPLNPEQREYVQTIGMSAEALIQLTGDILDFARIESGKLKLELQDCDVRECVEEALELLAGRAAAKHIDLLHWIDPAVPKIIKADTGRLRQVLVNLLTNAIKFTDAGEVEVSVDASTPGTGGPWPERTLTFTVRDTGLGIAAENHDKLFRPFSQIDDSMTRRHGGTGLGLAICKNLVTMMGGGISLASELGKGSTFVFTIWARTERQPPEVAPQLAGIRIGICSDSLVYRDELSRLCERWGGIPVEARELSKLGSLDWSVAVLDLDNELARAQIARPDPDPLVPREKSVALIPVSLPSDLRAELRKRFRAIVNKPLRHETFPSLILGVEAQVPVAEVVREHQGMGLRTLLVEDNVVNQKLMQRLLDQLGCPWVLAENGREALEALSNPLMTFDLVLLDLHMPEVDGLTVLEKVRAGEVGPLAQTLWIIALTADARPEQREKVVALGGNDYLTKPLKIGTLTSALRRFVVERGNLRKA